jgi:hypothetical protein
MIKGIVDNIDKYWLGAMVASMQDLDQIAFFRGFCDEMKNWTPSINSGMQLHAINKGLTTDEKDMLANLSYRDEGEF